MGVSARTVQRWVKQGIERRWFRRVVRVNKNLTTIYLSGLGAVCSQLEIDDLGAIAEVPANYLGRSEAKALCTALEAQYRQQQAYWAAKRAAKGRRKLLY